MECPTCFQKITAPDAPAAKDAKFILSGSKVQTRPIPSLAPSPMANVPSSGSKISLVWILLAVLVCVGAVAWFAFRGENSPQTPMEATINSIPAQPERKHGAIGLGAWRTQVAYTNIVVTKGTNTLFKSDFIPGAPGWRPINGVWIATNGVFFQTSIADDCRAVAGDPAWSDYTMTVRARKLGGMEGFLILFNVVDDQNCTWWNIGGWDNTCHEVSLMNTVSGRDTILSDKVPGKIDTGRWYNIRVELNGDHMRCYLDDVLIHDLAYSTAPSTPN